MDEQLKDMNDSIQRVKLNIRQCENCSVHTDYRMINVYCGFVYKRNPTKLKHKKSATAKSNVETVKKEKKGYWSEKVKAEYSECKTVDNFAFANEGLQTRYGYFELNKGWIRK